MTEPMSPTEAVNRYFKDRENELSETTKREYGYRLNAFTEWCDKVGLDNLNDLTALDVQNFKEWRAKSVKHITLKGDMWTVRSLIEFCEHIGVVPEGIHRKVRIPTVSHEQEVNEARLTKEEANAILDHLNKFEYASLRHALFITLWKTGMRRGTLYALDIDDFNEIDGTLSIRHRPATGTPLKNKKRGERLISITAEHSQILADYIEQTRPSYIDEYGREPLFVGESARAQKTTIQRNIYTATRPCHYTNECPYDREIDECEALTYNTASKCPSSVGPHALRKGYVTAALNAGQAQDVTGERTNMSRRVLEKHYDQRTEAEKMEQRRQHLKNV